MSLSLVLLIFTFAVKTFAVQGPSMLPTLKTGDRVFAVDFLRSPEQGDIVIIDENNGSGEPLIKRVVALGGQTVYIEPESGRVYVDGVEFAVPAEGDADSLRGDFSYPVTVPEGYIFVMGDNRAESLDSRYSVLGFIDERCVVGREVTVLG